jgi:hypothetical protein
MVARRTSRRQTGSVQRIRPFRPNRPQPSTAQCCPCLTGRKATVRADRGRAHARTEIEARQAIFELPYCTAS